MVIIIAATKTCHHRPIIEEQLQDASLPYEVVFFEDHPEKILYYRGGMHDWLTLGLPVVKANNKNNMMQCGVMMLNLNNQKKERS